MKRFVSLIVLGVLFVSGVAFGQKVDSTRKKLKLSAVADTVTSLIDSVKIADVGAFHPEVVTMRGFSKRAGESKESFMLVNNSNLHISRVELRLKYVDVNEVLLHEREVMVECDLPSYSSRITSIKTFDEGHKFHYLYSKSVKDDAVAFLVKFTLLRYDIVISKP